MCMLGAFVKWCGTWCTDNILQNWRLAIRFNGDRDWIESCIDSCPGGNNSLAEINLPLAENVICNFVKLYRLKFEQKSYIS